MEIKLLFMIILCLITISHFIRCDFEQNFLKTNLSDDLMNKSETYLNEIDVDEKILKNDNNIEYKTYVPVKKDRSENKENLQKMSELPDDFKTIDVDRSRMNSTLEQNDVNNKRIEILNLMNDLEKFDDTNSENVEKISKMFENELSKYSGESGNKNVYTILLEALKDLKQDNITSNFSLSKKLLSKKDSTDRKNTYSILQEALRTVRNKISDDWYNIQKKLIDYDISDIEELYTNPKIFQLITDLRKINSSNIDSEEFKKNIESARNNINKQLKNKASENIYSIVVKALEDVRNKIDKDSTILQYSKPEISNIIKEENLSDNIENKKNKNIYFILLEAIENMLNRMPANNTTINNSPENLQDTTNKNETNDLYEESVENNKNEKSNNEFLNILSKQLKNNNNTDENLKELYKHPDMSEVMNLMNEIMMNKNDDTNVKYKTKKIMDEISKRAENKQKDNIYTIMLQAIDELKEKMYIRASLDENSQKGSLSLAEKSDSDQKNIYSILLEAIEELINKMPQKNSTMNIQENNENMYIVILKSLKELQMKLINSSMGENLVLSDINAESNTEENNVFTILSKAFEELRLKILSNSEKYSEDKEGSIYKPDKKHRDNIQSDTIKNDDKFLKKLYEQAMKDEDEKNDMADVLSQNEILKTIEDLKVINSPDIDNEDIKKNAEEFKKHLAKYIKKGDNKHIYLLMLEAYKEFQERLTALTTKTEDQKKYEPITEEEFLEKFQKKLLEDIGQKNNAMDDINMKPEILKLVRDFKKYDPSDINRNDLKQKAAELKKDIMKQARSKSKSTYYLIVDAIEKMKHKLDSLTNITRKSGRSKENDTKKHYFDDIDERDLEKEFLMKLQDKLNKNPANKTVYKNYTQTPEVIRVINDFEPNITAENDIEIEAEKLRQRIIKKARKNPSQKNIYLLILEAFEETKLKVNKTLEAKNENKTLNNTNLRGHEKSADEEDDLIYARGDTDDYTGYSETSKLNSPRKNYLLIATLPTVIILLLFFLFLFCLLRPGGVFCMKCEKTTDSTYEVLKGLCSKPPFVNKTE